MLAATGFYSDSRRRPIKSASWCSSDSSVVTVTASGVATGVAVGTATVTASANDPRGSAVSTLRETGLVPVAIAPAAVTTGVGDTERLTATGTFGDGNTQDLAATARWTSSVPAVAGVNLGVVTGLSEGTAPITAADPATGKTSSAAAVTVTTAELVSLAITPPVPASGASWWPAGGRRRSRTSRGLDQSMPPARDPGG